MNLLNAMIGLLVLSIGVMIYSVGASNGLTAALSSDLKVSREAAKRMLLNTVNCDQSFSSTTCASVGALVPLYRLDRDGTTRTVVSNTNPPSKIGDFAVRAECHSSQGTTTADGLVIRAVRLSSTGGLTSTASTAFLKDPQLNKIITWADSESLLFGSSAQLCSIGRTPIHTEQSGTPIQSATCFGTNTGGWCTGYYYIDVTFPTPFIRAPAVLVSMAQPNSVAGGCSGSSDRNDVRAINITTTGFRMICSSSPNDARCPNPVPDTAPLLRNTLMLRSQCHYFAIEK